MNFLARIIVFFLLLPFFALANTKTSSKNIDQLVKEMDTYTEEARKIWNVPAVAVVIIYKGQPYFILKGTKSVSDKTPIDEKTRFHLFSLTKGMTAALMLKLEEKGLISLDDPIIKYIPDFKLSNSDIAKTLTIKDVLSQSVGLKQFAGDSFLKLGFSEKETWEAMAELPIKKITGKDYTYSNQFHGLMKQIIEKVTKKPLEVTAKELLFDPLKMSNTTYAPLYGRGFLSSCSKTKKLQDDFAKPHVIYDGVKEIPNIDQVFVQQASMAVSSTIEDMANWLKFLMYGNPEVLKNDWFNQLRVPRNHYLLQSQNSMIFPKSRHSTLDYCFGAMLLPYGKGENKINLYRQNGARQGGTTCLAYSLEYDLGIVILCNLGANQDCLLPEAIMFKLFDTVMGINDTDWKHVTFEHTNETLKKYRDFFEQSRFAAPTPHEDLTPYIGNYCNRLYGTITLKIKDNVLWVSYRGKEAKTTHLNGNRFTFVPAQLSSGYSSTDYGFIDLGYAPSDRARHAMTCNLMNEGDDTIFIQTK